MQASLAMRAIVVASVANAFQLNTLRIRPSWATMLERSNRYDSFLCHRGVVPRSGCQSHSFLHEASSPRRERDPQEKDTIFALSSGFSGKQATALAVIRISGPNASTVLQGLLHSKADFPPVRKASLRKLVYSGRVVDHALVLFFRSPRSYTGEDLVELHCHGSRAVVRDLLEVLPELDCRLADPGEFTQRGFDNGKLDLLQVEGLADLLAADTRVQAQQAFSQMQGDLSSLYSNWRSTLVAGLAHAEAVIDFGDDEYLGASDASDDPEAQWDVWGDAVVRMKTLRKSMESHLRDNHRGEAIREGVKIAIVGAPNAGKSSIFNILARDNAAIVSPVAGTTRDVIQVTMDLKGFKCILQDTAGIRQNSTDAIENEGMTRAIAAATEADIVVAMIDATNLVGAIDRIQTLLSVAIPKKGQIMLVVNKMDLVSEFDLQENLQNEFGDVIRISCKTSIGIDDFLAELANRVECLLESPSSSNKENGMITRARHRQHVEESVKALRRFEDLTSSGALASDMAAEELRLAASELGRITGVVDVEDVLDVLFSDFCIGK